uniref:Nuclear RNA export factor Tap RNA-binding domain-containing protein n=1 Tax=Equus caballus TaxID=9796 RepID=A0A9L0S2W0_HORSE
MGHNNQPNFLQRRARCWGIYRRRYSNWSEEVSSGIHPSSHQQQDEDPGKSDAPVDTGIRYAPYAIPPCHRRGTFQKQDQTHVNMEREQKPPERRTEGNKQDETSGSWFKIMVPFGIKYDEKWLLSLIQKQCSVPFTPVEFHYEKMQAQFFVENANIAFALKNINGKIWDKNNERISIFVSPSDAPCSVQKELKSEKLTMHKLYDVSRQSLDIHKLRFDPALVTLGVEMVPNPGNDMAASLQIHGENMPKLLPWNLSNTKPCQLAGLSTTMQNASNIKNLNLPSNEVKAAGKLDKGQGLEPEEMSADRNSLCTTFPDKSTNIRSVVPSVASWEPELPLTVTVCRRQQSWSSGWTTGPAISFLCPSPVLRGQASQGHSPSLPPQVTSSCLDLQSIPGSPKMGVIPQTRTRLRQAPVHRGHQERRWS